VKIFLTPLVVIQSIIRAGCHVLKAVTTTETLRAAIAVSLQFCVARCRSLMHNQNRVVSRRCLLCYQLVTVMWSVATDKILLPFQPTARCPSRVQLVYQHHKLQRIQLHRLTAAVSMAVLPVQVR